MLPVDPNPVDIIQKERIEELIQSVRFSRTILSQSGLMRAYLRYFVRRHLALTVLKDHPNLFPTDEQIKQWVDQNNSISDCLSMDDVRFKLAVQPACLLWARQQWNHLLSSLFLSQKTDLINQLFTSKGQG